MRSLLDSTEAGWIGRNEEDGDLSHAPGAGAVKVLGPRDSAAVKIVLIRQAHHLHDYSRKVCRRHAGIAGNGVDEDVGSVDVVDKT
jgi:hypothetical protein